MSWLSKLSGRGKANGSGGSTPAKARPSNPPFIRVDRHEYLPEEFALGSFRIRPYDGDLIAKQQFDFRLAFELDNEPVEFGCRGLVVKMDDQVGLVAHFRTSQPFYERKLIEYMKLWKGL